MKPRKIFCAIFILFATFQQSSSMQAHHRPLIMGGIFSFAGAAFIGIGTILRHFDCQEISTICSDVCKYNADSQGGGLTLLVGGIVLLCNGVHLYRK